MAVSPVSKLLAKPVLVESTEGGARPWYFALVACFFSKPVLAVADVAAANAVEPVAVAEPVVALVNAAVVAEPVVAVVNAVVAEPVVAEPVVVADVAVAADAVAEPVVSVAVRGPLKTVCEEPDPE